MVLARRVGERSLRDKIRIENNGNRSSGAIRRALFQDKFQLLFNGLYEERKEKKMESFNKVCILAMIILSLFLNIEYIKFSQKP